MLSVVGAVGQSSLLVAVFRAVRTGSEQVSENDTGFSLTASNTDDLLHSALFMGCSISYAVSKNVSAFIE